MKHPGLELHGLERVEAIYLRQWAAITLEFRGEAA